MALTQEERRIAEGSTPIYRATLQDEDGTAIPLADIDSMTLTLKDVRTGQAINSRSAQDVLNTNGVTIHATSGLLTWQMEEEDTPIIGSAHPKPNQVEQHKAIFRWTYDTDRHGVHVVLLDVVQIDDEVLEEDP